MKKGFIGLFFGAVCIIMGWICILTGNARNTLVIWSLFVFGIAFAVAGAIVGLKETTENKKGKSNKQAVNKTTTDKHKENEHLEAMAILTALATYLCVLAAVVCTIWQAVLVVRGFIETQNPLSEFSIPLMAGSFGGMFGSWAFYSWNHRVHDRKDAREKTTTIQAEEIK